jgi:hypothetical protein
LDTAVVSTEGVGLVKLAAKSSPVTWGDVAKVFVVLMVKPNPVSDVPAEGLTPTLPAESRGVISYELEI